MRYLAVLGRQPEISLAELATLFDQVRQSSSELATFSCNTTPNIDRLGGSLKIAQKLEAEPLDFLKNLPDGKITLGISDYSAHASKHSATTLALKFKKILIRHGRSVRVVPNTKAALPTATSIHNGIAGKKPTKVELILADNLWWKVIGVQDIEAYAKRDQIRPARDAKVGMLPPKLAQILINLCGKLSDDATILDPFCGTGVVLQEASLMGYRIQGTDISERMVEYTKKNLQWLAETRNKNFHDLQLDNVSLGDATAFKWKQPIDAVACEGYLGKPMSLPPAEIKLKAEKQECKTIVLGFLKNLSGQIESNTPVVIAVPAWLRPDGNYSRLQIVDEISELGYNVNNKSRRGLLYYREGQVVARDIIILRKK